MTSSTGELLALRGSQTPRLWSAPPAATTTGPEAVELAAQAGLYLDPWQQFVLRHGLGEKPEWCCRECIYRTPADRKTPCPEHPDVELVHPWSAPTVTLICPRQNGKNAILEARELVGLFVLGERRIIHSAHLQDTATLQFRRVLSLIQGTPNLARRMLKPVFGKGSEAILLRSGQSIEFKTRTSKVKRGDSIDLVVFDEAYELPVSAISAMVPTTFARPNTQTWYTSSAVDQEKHQHGVTLARQRERGIAGRPDTAFFEWSCEGDNPSQVPPEIFDNPGEWARANPSYGVRQSPEALQRAHDGDMGAREFSVEGLGIGDWPATDDLAAKIIPLAKWDALEDVESSLKDPVSLAFDVSWDRTRACIAVAGQRPDGASHIEVIDYDRGTSWVPPRFAELARKVRPAFLVCDPGGPAGSLVPDVEAALGKELTKVSTKELGQAFGLFLDGVEDRSLHHLGSEDRHGLELRAAVDGAKKRSLGDAFAWDRKTAGADISPLVTCTLALWGEVQRRNKPKFAFHSMAEVLARANQGS